MSQSVSNKFTPYIAWLLATCFVFFQFFLQTASSVMSESWVNSFHLNTVQLSNLSASFFYPYVLMQIPVGVLYDKFKAKKLLISAGIVLSAGCFMLASAKSYEVAIIGRIFMGTGSAFGFIGMLKVIINNFASNKFAVMLGSSEAIAMTVVTLSIIALAHILQIYSWRYMMFACGLFAVSLVIAITFLMQDKNTPMERNTASFVQVLGQVGVLMVNKQVILGSMYGFFMFAIINVFTSLWGVSFIVNTYGFSQELASSMVSVVFIGVALGGPTNGMLSKKLNNHTRIMIVGALCATFMACLIILVPNLSKLVIYITLLLAGMCCSVYVQALTVIKDSVNTTVQATALAASNMIIMAGAPILQIVVGLLLNSHSLGLATSNAGNYRTALAVLPLGMLAAFVISFFIKEPPKRVLSHTVKV